MAFRSLTQHAFTEAGAASGGPAVAPGTFGSTARNGFDAASSIALAAGDAALAILAFAANQAVTGQVSAAHAFADLVREQADDFASAGRTALPGGVLREAVASWAEVERRFAEDVIAAAGRYGRSCAHLAFAFPVPNRRPR